jgi:molecular chaperone DnaJ
MANEKDYYELLGVAQTASQDEIRKAYLKLAHAYHPDKTGGDKAAEEKLKEVNMAYDTLKNPEKRKEYDQAKQAREAFGAGFDSSGFTRGGGFRGAEGFGGAEGFSGFDFGGGGGGGGGFEDLFGNIFGGAAGARPGTHRSRAVQPGRDIEFSMRVSLLDVLNGAKKTIRVPRSDVCAACNGSGAAPGTKPEVCPDCGGTGQVLRGSQSFQISRTCPRCRGAGSFIANPCPTCRGSGNVQTQREITVDIPKGVASGQRLRIAGEGDAGGPGAPRGDLYLHIEVDAHPTFERQGNHILTEVPVTITAAALGAKVRVPTLTGEADVKIAPGTQTGAQLRLRGLGLPVMRGKGRGDQIVRITVEVPTKLSPEARSLMEQLAAIEDPSHYPSRKAHKRQREKAK